jgi:hypothetical protein
LTGKRPWGVPLCSVSVHGITSRKPIGRCELKKLSFLVFVVVAMAGTALGESLPESTTSKNSEEADLYGMFLDQWSGGAAKIIHVARVAEAPPTRAMVEYAACLKEYRLVPITAPASSLQLAETSLAHRSIVRLVDPKTWKIRDPGPAISGGKPTDNAVNDGFAAGLMTFFRPIYDQEHRVAIFSYSFVCGGLCGGGGGVIFEKTASEWKQRGMPCGGWVS